MSSSPGSHRRPGRSRPLRSRWDPYIVVELNPKTVARQTTLGRSIVYGDISNPEVLESAGIHRADAVVLTNPDDDAVLRACQAIREAKSEVFIAVRTSYLSSAFAATSVGADEVTVAEVATAEAMARQVLRRMTERRGGARFAGRVITRGSRLHRAS